MLALFKLIIQLVSFLQGIYLSLSLSLSLKLAKGHIRLILLDLNVLNNIRYGPLCTTVTKTCHNS
jgi:hypothetical protein